MMLNQHFQLSQFLLINAKKLITLNSMLKTQGKNSDRLYNKIVYNN